MKPTINLRVTTNLDDVKEKMRRLETLLEEAYGLIDSLKAEGIKIDVTPDYKADRARSNNCCITVNRPEELTDEEIRKFVRRFKK